MRGAFETTVLWGAFFRPAGPSFSLLALAAQRSPVLDGFITDVVGAEFWWRATQQGVKGPGDSVARTYSEQELLPFLEVFEVLFEPEGMERAPISRSLGNYAGMVGLRTLDRPPREIRERDPGASARARTPQTRVVVLAGSIDAEVSVLLGCVACPQPVSTSRAPVASSAPPRRVVSPVGHSLPPRWMRINHAIPATQRMLAT